MAHAFSAFTERCGILRAPLCCASGLHPATRSARRGPRGLRRKEESFIRRLRHDFAALDSPPPEHAKTASGGPGCAHLALSAKVVPDTCFAARSA
jgi:hypothetical protein